MPSIAIGDIHLAYRFDGADDAPVLMLSNSIGTDLSLWDRQISAFTPDFRVLRYDTRGHGKSGVTVGPYSVEQLGHDVLALLDALDIGKIYFCGLSLGGITGIWLGLHAPTRIERLVLSNTGAKIGSDELWQMRIGKVQSEGMESIAEGALERWFSARSPEAVESARRMLVATPPDGYAGCCAALRDADLRDSLANIALPTLVITGSEDRATPPADGQFIAEHIPGARQVTLPAAHLSNIECADAFNAEVMRFLTKAPVGVGIMVAHNPLHRSGRAVLPHPALASGDDANSA